MGTTAIQTPASTVPGVLTAFSTTNANVVIPGSVVKTVKVGSICVYHRDECSH